MAKNVAETLLAQHSRYTYCYFITNDFFMFNFRHQSTAAIGDINNFTRQLFDILTEISESAKLAEEYRSKFLERLAHIESCEGQANDLLAKLKTCNTELAASARRSFGIVRSSVASLLPTESTDVPIDSLRAAVLELEQLRGEQPQMRRRYDRLLMFLQTCTRPTEPADDAERLRRRSLAVADGMETESDEVILLPDIPDGMNTGGVDLNADWRITLEASDDRPTATMPTSAVANPCFTNSFGGVSMPSDATHTVGSACHTSNLENLYGVVGHSRSAEPASAGHVESTSAAGIAVSCGQMSSNSQAMAEETAAQSTTSLDDSMRSPRAELRSPQGSSRLVGHPRGRSRVRWSTTGQSGGSETFVVPARENVDNAIRSSSAEDSLRRRVGSFQQASSTSPSSSAQLVAATQPISSVEQNVESARAEEFKSRGRRRGRPATTVRSHSSDNLHQSSVPSDAHETTTGSEVHVVKTRGRKSKSAAQNGDIGNDVVVRPRRHKRNKSAALAGDVGRNSVEDSIQSAAPERPEAAGIRELQVAKPEQRKRNKSAAQTNDAVRVLPADVSSVISTNSAQDSVQPAVPTEVFEAAASDEPQVVKRRRRRQSKSAAQNGDSAALSRDSVGNVIPLNSTAEASVQPAVLSDAADGSGHQVVKAQRYKHSRSAATASSKKTSREQLVDGKAVSRRGRRTLQGEITAGAGGTVVPKPARHRSCGPRIPAVASAGRKRRYSVPANGVQSPATSRNANNFFSLLAANSTSPSHHPVTTYLSGPRTDIFQQYPPHQSAASRNSSLSPVRYVSDDEVLFRLPVPANTSTPDKAAR